jgi:hypothetical protein
MHTLDWKKRVRLLAGCLLVTVPGCSGPFMFVYCVSVSFFLFVVVKKISFKMQIVTSRGASQRIVLHRAFDANC